ncbi:MAG: SprT family zinc-dependent metalloprotease [Kiritimatiellae bacterium]|nr:SprT family zinc-dependent metalloprotease [Kiritimatiellia bacterium]MDD4734609.1 SprT family zinc-dependent metalloprotease [Kiritimatiellia bacterium]
MKNSLQPDRVIEFGNRRIPYRLTRQSRKHIRILVAPDLTVRVSAPPRAEEEQIEHVLRQKARWIARKLDKVRNFHPLPAPREYISGETFCYLGRQYRLKVDKGEKAPAKLKGKFLYVTVPDKQDRDAVKKAVENWYKQRAEETVLRCLDKCTGVAGRHGIPAAALTLRKMRTRWGSCSSKGRITINTNLIQAPIHCIEYVIMHELCHLKHHNHSKAFYKLLTQCMPDWPKRKEALQRVVIPRENGNTPVGQHGVTR